MKAKIKYLNGARKTFPDHFINKFLSKKLRCHSFTAKDSAFILVVDPGRLTQNLKLILLWKRKSFPYNEFYIPIAANLIPLKSCLKIEVFLFSKTCFPRKSLESSRWQNVEQHSVTAHRFLIVRLQLTWSESDANKDCWNEIWVDVRNK